MKVWDKAPLLPLAGCFIAGIVSRVLLAQWTAGLALLVVALAVTLLLGKWARWQTAGIWLCVFLLGMTLGAKRQQALEVEWPKGNTVQEVVVISEPVVKERWVVLNTWSADGKQKVRLHIQRNKDSERITIGDGLLINAHINKVRAWTRDSVRTGQRDHFDYQRYMQCHGFTGEGFVRDGCWQWRQVSLRELSALQRTRLRFLCWRHELLERYRQWGISDKAYGIMAAMTLGEKSHIDPQTRKTYSEVGASHILALSGLHLMIIYGVISLLVSWQRIRLLSQVLIILSVWAFAMLTGLSPSMTRAASMITVYSLLSLGYREKMSANTLAFVAIVMLVVNPLALYDFGFQLSFVAVLAIVLLNPLLYGLIPLHILQRHGLLKACWGLITVSVSAQIGTAPLVAYYFGYFSTLFLLTNFVVIPLATVILYLTPLLLAVSCWAWGVTMVATLLSSIVLLMNSILKWIAQLPYCSISGLHPSAAQVALVYVVIGCAYIVVSLRYPATHRSV